MADPKLDALILQLSGMRTLLLKQAGTNVKKRNSIIENFERTITGLKEEKERATTEKQKVEFYNKVEGMAKGFQGMTEAALALKNAVEGGDPFAISASTLDLAASLVATVSMAGGPIGAAVGAAFGAILSIVSMILKIFQKESKSLVSQIEQMMRKINARESNTRSSNGRRLYKHIHKPRNKNKRKKRKSCRMALLIQKKRRL